ncbi:hypothetical protein BO83DRAFT_402632 [Aspergillus eucalypticola CBS 122712]|uniref:Uncharacterized protein n=1 Tax=Aspergillus eucalypticola (strain CBS 122712 / IBT 29274) TaxID=1448314 RepID=A0A317UQZ1_ASPEC|nr:uncharacterized protein BO83DRAFT_402632 [Aspergillus eucalypticola CBS 122712]PWY64141.1 hypothetical protein BO83DRAFT_402632 [Aspergillus eucalypticola CBS 122712]
MEEGTVPQDDRWLPISACSVRTRILFVGSNPRLIETSLKRKRPCDGRDRQQWRGSGEAGNGRFHLLVSWVRDRLTLPDPVRHWYYTRFSMPVLLPSPNLNLNQIIPAVASLVFFLFAFFRLSFAGGSRRYRIWRVIVSALQIPWRSAHDPINLSQFPWEAVAAHCFAVRTTTTTHHHH